MNQYSKRRTGSCSNHSYREKPSIIVHDAIDSDLSQQVTHSHPLLRQVLRFIDQHYRQPISLQEVAEAVGRSPSYLTNFIRRETGITIPSWIRERRMIEARRLLLSTEDSVEQIAAAVGYADRRHFIRQFRQIHHQPPHLWRTTHQTEHCL